MFINSQRQRDLWTENLASKTRNAKISMKEDAKNSNSILFRLRDFAFVFLNGPRF